MDRFRAIIVLICGCVALAQGFRIHTSIRIWLFAVGALAIVYGLFRLFSRYGRTR